MISIKSESLTNNQIGVAEILLFQQEIFNCAMEEVWERYLHPATRNAHAHKKEEILNYANELLNKKQLQSIRAKKPSVIKYQVAKINGYKIECEQQQKDAFLLRIYKGDPQKLNTKHNILIYEHPKLLRMFDVKRTLKQLLNIRYADLNWEHYEKRKGVDRYDK